MSLTLVSRFAERFRRFCSWCRCCGARAAGAKIAAGCQLGPGCDLNPGHNLERRGQIQLAENCVIGAGVIFHPHGGSIRLGHDVFLGPYTVVYGHGGVEIGDDTLVSMHCRILSSEHAMPPPDLAIRSQPDVLHATRVGRDVWLGAGVTVLGGVTIGDGCIVGAGAVVRENLPPHSVAVGVPARVIRRRQ